MSRIMKLNEKGADVEGTFAWIEERLRRLEGHIFPDGSGTERYDGSGTGRYDNWTQHSDGTDYPGSYGVGPVAGDLAAGDSVRILKADQTVDPDIHKVVIADGDRVALDDGKSYARFQVVRVVVPKV